MTKTPKKTSIILTLILITLMNSSGLNALKTCINQTNTTFCFDTNQDMYESGLTFYEGQNDKYGLYIENPDTGNKNWIDYTMDFVIAPFVTNKIDMTKLTDETTFTFESYQDFYNVLQQKNAIGNVTLFTKSNLYEQERQKTSSLTGEVVNWTYILIILVMEFFRIIIDLLLIIITMLLIFRGIPMALNFVKKITIKSYVWSKK